MHSLFLKYLHHHTSSQVRAWHGLKIVVLSVAVLFICIIAGASAAILPAGTVARLSAFPILLVTLLLVWAMPKRVTAPDGYLNGMLLILLALINLWPQYVIYRIGGLPSISPIKIAWLVFILSSLFCVITCRPATERLLRRCAAHSPLIGFICFLAIWRIVCTLVSSEPVAQTWKLGSELLSFYFVFFMALAVLRDETDVYRLLAVLVIAASIQAILASYESVVQHTLFEKFMSVNEEDPSTLQSVLLEKFRGGHYRAQGTFDHPMVLAEFFAMMVPISVAVFLQNKNLTLRWLSAGLIPLAIAMIVASRSRSGIAVLLAAVLLVLLLLMLPRNSASNRQNATPKLLIIVFLLPVLVAVTYFAGAETLALIAGRNQNEVNSTMARVLMLEKGIPLIFESPILGYGNGLGAVKLGFFDGIRYNIDNYFLGIALDAGIPGLLSLVSVLGISITLGLKSYTQGLGNASRTSGLIAVSLVMLVGVKSVLSITSGFTMAYVLIAALIVLREKQQDTKVLIEKLPNGTSLHRGEIQ